MEYLETQPRRRDKWFFLFDVKLVFGVFGLYLII